MIHQPLGGTQGQATEIEIAAKHILKTKEKLNRMLAENTGKDYETVCADTERDNWKSAEEALEYGLIHAGRHTDAYRGHVAFDIAHGIIDRHTGRHTAPGAVDIQMDVFFRVLGEILCFVIVKK